MALQNIQAALVPKACQIRSQAKAKNLHGKPAINSRTTHGFRRTARRTMDVQVYHDGPVSGYAAQDLKIPVTADESVDGRQDHLHAIHATLRSR